MTDSILFHDLTFMRDSIAHHDEIIGMVRASAHRLPPVRPHLFSADDWIVAFLLVGFIIISVIVHNNRRHLADNMSHFFQNKRHFSMKALPLKTDVFYSLLAVCVSCGSLALMTYSFIPRAAYPHHFTTYQVLLTVALSLLVWVYVKAAIYRFVNWVFFPDEEDNHWLSSYFLINSSFVFVTFPLAAVTVFTQTGEMSVCIIMLSLLFLYKILVGYKLFRNFPVKNNGVFLIILYFCSVEILPILTIAHLIGVDATYSKVIF